MESRALNIVLTRLTTIGNSVIGRLDIPGLPYPLWTLEDAKEFIPAAEYHCGLHGWADEPVKIKKVYEVQNVPGRTAILFHAGNDDEDTRGCILVGRGVMQNRLTNSVDALNLMRSVVGQNGFDLQIHASVSA